MSTPFRPRMDPRPHIEKALDRAIELSVGTRRYMITDGRLVYERHRRYRYTFTLTQGSWLPFTQAKRSLPPREHFGPIRLEAPRRARQYRWRGRGASAGNSQGNVSSR